MTRRTRNILIIGFGVLAVGLMVFAIVFPKKGKEEPASVAQAEKEKEVPVILPSAPKTPPLDTLSPEERAKAQAQAASELEVTRTARMFVERYGSYSNQGNYENVSDLYSLMTANMRKAADAFVQAQKTEHPPGVYFGVTTKAVSANISSLAGNEAIIVVGTQRQEQGASPRVVYQSAAVVLTKTGFLWKVEDIDWGE